MTETLTMREAFLADIIANPEDDAPRLIYADWLDDNGDEARAEFIRVQCERARRVAAGMRMDDAERRMRDREADLLAMHHHEWLCEMAGQDTSTSLIPDLAFRFPGLGWIQPIFMRGFVGRLKCRVREWVQHHATLTRWQPISELEAVHWFSYENLLSQTIPLTLRMLSLSSAEAHEYGRAVILHRSGCSALNSFSHYVGWHDTLREIRVDQLTPNARDYLLQHFPRQRLCLDGTVYSSEMSNGNRKVLSRPQTIFLGDENA